MSVSDEMKDLTQSLLRDYDEQVAAIASIRLTTMQEMDTFRTGRQAMAADERQRASEYMTGLRRDTTAMLSEADAAYRTTATERHKCLDEYLAGLKHSVDELRHDTGAFLKELDASQQAMAAGERKRLSEYATALRCDVTTLSTTLRTARQTMSAEQEQRTSEHLAGLRHSVDTLCNNASAFMKELDASHEAMTAQQQQWLGAERVRLAADVATLRAGFRAAQNQLRTDHREAQRLWSWLGKLMKQRRAAQPT